LVGAELSVNIVFRDRWLLVVDKPAGTLTQGTEKERGIFEELQDKERYVGLHHRLDRPASGLVLFTVDRRANKGISARMQAHEIDRTYSAVLSGRCESGTWDQPVSRRTARSEVRVLDVSGGFSQVEVSLHTGRKHQIRVHAALNRTPVLGDRRYGAEAGRMWPRLALHARRLALKHPITGERLELESPIPDDLSELWQGS